MMVLIGLKILLLDFSYMTKFSLETFSKIAYNIKVRFVKP